MAAAALLVSASADDASAMSYADRMYAAQPRKEPTSETRDSDPGKSYLDKVSGSLSLKIIDPSEAESSSDTNAPAVTPAPPAREPAPAAEAPKSFSFDFGKQPKESEPAPSPPVPTPEPEAPKPPAFSFNFGKLADKAKESVQSAAPDASVSNDAPAPSPAKAAEPEAPKLPAFPFGFGKQAEKTQDSAPPPEPVTPGPAKPETVKSEAAKPAFSSGAKKSSPAPLSTPGAVPERDAAPEKAPATPFGASAFAPSAPASSPTPAPSPSSEAPKPWWERIDELTTTKQETPDSSKPAAFSEPVKQEAKPAPAKKAEEAKKEVAKATDTGRKRKTNGFKLFAAQMLMLGIYVGGAYALFAKPDEVAKLVEKARVAFKEATKSASSESA